MKQAINKWFYSLVWAASIIQAGTADAAMIIWSDKVQDWMKWSTESIDQSVQTMIITGMTFLYLIAVVYGLWWGFNILTAAWDEEKVKKWKTIIMHAIIWLVVIWLVWSIINWVVTQLLWTT